MARPLTYLVIHCTATPEGRAVSAEEIRRWHTAPPPRGRGWSRVGYTDMIHLDGRIERLQANNEDEVVDAWEVTNGAKGYNAVSRHIVYVGGLDGQGRPKDTRTPAQKAAMAHYLKAFRAQHPRVRILGHSDLAAKDCPCFDVAAYLRSIGLSNP